jgi:hypothetical protein
MTNLELLHDLNRRHARIEVALDALKDDLLLLNARFEAQENVAVAPPPPFRPAPSAAAAEYAQVAPPPLPEMPPVVDAPLILPSLPTAAREPMPESAPAPVEGPGFELQFGRWLARIGVVFALFTLIFFSVLVHNTLYQYLGPWSKLTVLAVVSGGLFFAGLRLEKRDSKMIVYGRTLAGGGLACLYYTLYGAIYVPQLQVISSPLLGGCLLLAWSAAVLIFAEKRKSELLSIFAISLAYFSSAITPGNGFSMTADLILAVTAVVFLLRNAWTGLSFLCLVGTYAGFLRQTVVYDGPLDFRWVGTLPFWPSAVYLTGAWLIFSSAILLSRSPHFAAGKRMAFLCLNNGAWVGLLIVAANLGAFGHMGGIFGTVGGLLLGACALARIMHPDSRDMAGAYLAQGLALATGGIAIAYSGMTRGLLITIESVFLVASGAFSRNRILRIGGALAAVLGAAYLANELVFSNSYPWMLTFGGAFAMLANAWLARRELWSEPREVANARWVPESVLHVVLAVGLLLVGICCHAPDAWIASDLSFVALGLTFAIYIAPIFELPVLGQVLLPAAQVISFLQFNFDSTIGWPYDMRYATQPQWSQSIVALATMLLATWWPRQKFVRLVWWFQPLMVIYSLAMVAYTYDTIYPYASEQKWMMSAALLSLVFLAYGAWSRLWAFAVSGQILLGLSVYTFLFADNTYGFPWTWWAAAVPIAVVFGTGWIGRHVLPRYVKISVANATAFPIVARVYQSVALGLLIRWVFGVAPYPEITFLLLALGTAFVAGSLFLRSSYGVRSGFVLSAAGVVQYLTNTGIWNNAFTWLDAGAFALLLAQPALLRRWGRELITNEESWVLIVVSSAVGWAFVSNSVNAAAPHDLTLAWALFAVALTGIGFIANERRQRWCGLAILIAAFVRVAVHDFWGFSDLYKVLTFFVLTVICLGMSFLYYKFADRLKEWL